MQEEIYRILDTLREVEGILNDIQFRAFQLEGDISSLISSNMRLLKILKQEVSARRRQKYFRLIHQSPRVLLRANLRLEAANSRLPPSSSEAIPGTSTQHFAWFGSSLGNCVLLKGERRS